MSEDIETAPDYVPCESETVDADGVRWRPVAGYEGIYAVSEDGRVRSLARTRWNGSGWQAVPERVRKAVPNTNGYLSVRLSRDGRQSTQRVHALVAEAFHGPRPKGFDVCHNDGDRLNNHAQNLRFDSHAENIADAIKHGTHVGAAMRCPRGHAYSAENTRVEPSGGRRCRACRRRSSALDRMQARHNRLADAAGYPRRNLRERERAVR